MTNIDPDGRFAIEAYQKLESFTLDVFNSHQFQGGLQAIGGAAEVAAGLALCETGVGAPFGALAITQGADILQAGIQQILFNKAVDPLAVQGLQAAGMTHNNALIFNGGLSMALGGDAAALASVWGRFLHNRITFISCKCIKSKLCGYAGTVAEK